MILLVENNGRVSSVKNNSQEQPFLVKLQTSISSQASNNRLQSNFKQHPLRTKILKVSYFGQENVCPEGLEAKGRSIMNLPTYLHIVNANITTLGEIF